MQRINIRLDAEALGQYDLKNVTGLYVALRFFNIRNELLFRQIRLNVAQLMIDLKRRA
ncbi:hypothetical protein D3C86_2117490 [compost metagenome]